jgi:hypothetical protein
VASSQLRERSATKAFEAPASLPRICHPTDVPMMNTMADVIVYRLLLELRTVLLFQTFRENR